MAEPLDKARALLTARLRERRTEIEQATLARVHGVAEPEEGADSEYLLGIGAAVSAALDYAFAVLEANEKCPPPIPAALRGQARRAARNGVGLDTVLRRYLLGFTLFGDFVMEEAEAATPLRGISLQRLLTAPAARLDDVIRAVSEEYLREEPAKPALAEELRVAQIKRLLRGDPLSTVELDYDFEGWHLAAATYGSVASEGFQRLAEILDRRLLLASPQPGMTWIWLGGRRKLPSSAIAEQAHILQIGLPLAVGEPAKGLMGWRLSHRQARASLPLSSNSAEPVVRYADVGLLASIRNDELLVRSLSQLYLEPLADERDGGSALRQTLRAYLSAGWNITSTAATLGVSRQTVRTRLQVIEEKLGRSLPACAAEVEVALRLSETPYRQE